MPERVDCEQFADGVLDGFFADGVPIAQALGLKAAGQGQPDARRALRYLERDQAIRDLAEALGLDAMHDELTQFKTWRWPELRIHQQCPESLDEVESLMWTILKLSGGRVLGIEYLPEIIGPD